MHKLQKQILNVEYYNEDGVDQFYDKALHILYQDLNPEMEKILDKHSNAEEQIKINSLELNLGITYETELQSQWINRFKTEFENELLRKIEQLKKGTGSPDESIDKIGNNDLEILMFYLKNGSLPWQAGNSNINIHTLFDKILVEYPVEFDKKIRTEYKNEKLIQRIVIQFSDQQMERLIRVLQPSESLFIIQSASEIRKTQQRDQTVKSSTKEFRNAIWQFIVSYLITDQSSYFSTREFVSSLLHKMSAHYNIRIGLLIHEIYSSIHRVKMEPIHFQLGQLLQDIYQIEIKSNSPSIEKEFQNKQVIDYLKNESFDNAKNTQSSSYYNNLFLEWMGSSPLTLLQFLQKTPNKNLLRKIVELIPDKEIGNLIQIINPSDTTFVVQFKEDISKLQQEKNWINTSNKQFRDDLWVLLLDVILNEKNSLFSQKVFVLAALEKLSIHYNLDPTAFIGFILSLIDEHQNSINSTNLFHLFVEIKKDLTNKNKIQPLSEKVKIETYFVILTRFVSLEENPKKTTESAFVVSKKKKEIIEYLIQKSPKTLLVWMGEHLQSETESNKFIRNLNLSAVKKLVGFLGQMKGIELNKLVRMMLDMDSNIAHKNHIISELELYKIVFIFLTTSRKTDHIERRLLEILFKKTAIKLQVSEVKIVKSFIQESDKNAGILSKENKAFFEEKFQIIKSFQKKPTKQQIEEQSFNLKKKHSKDRFQSATEPKEIKKINGDFEHQADSLKVDEVLKLEVSKITSLKDLKTWFIVKLDLIQPTDLIRINKIVKAYFGRTAEKNWQAEIISEDRITEILNGISLIEKPFLSNYLIDLDLILHADNSDYKNFDVDWLRLKILQFWSVRKDFSQQELSTFLMQEMGIKIRKTASEIQSGFFENAVVLKRNLKSTLILDLGSDNPEKMKEHKSNDELKIKELIRSEQEKKSIKKPKKDKMDTIYIPNSGLVLLNPFIPVLLERAGLVVNKKFKSIEMQKRAVQLLQYCVGNKEIIEEYLLPLPKILCGLEIDDPIENEIQLSNEEKDLVKSLLENIIAQWSILGNTEIEGLQQTFLQRNGALRTKNENWELDVEKRPFDMLIDKIPWTYNLIKYPWMKKPVYTLWR